MTRILTGVVSSVSPDKSITVSIDTKKTHPIYKKQYLQTRKFMAHDENNQCQVGDKVVISECKPLSARKRFKLDKVVEKASLTQQDQEFIVGEEGSPEQSKDSDEVASSKEPKK